MQAGVSYITSLGQWTPHTVFFFLLKWYRGERALKNLDAVQMLITFSDTYSLVWRQTEGDVSAAAAC